MASRFWVGGGSANTWAATSSTNWAATSGGAGNQTVPGTSDVAIFDSNSGTGNSVIGASTAVQSLECDGSTLGTGAYAGTLTQNAGVVLTLNTGQANTLRFSAGMTYTPANSNAIVTLTHTSGTANIKSNGQKLFGLTINGAGGTTQILDTLLVNAGQNATLTVTSGIFDANGGSGGPFAVTATTVAASGSTTRSLILGSSVTIGGNVSAGQTIWNLGTTTNLTFTKNSATLTVLAPTSSIQSVAFSGGGLTYNGITLNALSNNTMFSLSGANTFSSFAINAGWFLILPNNTTTTISAAFTWTGTAANPILIGSTGNLVQVGTLSVPSGACTLKWGGLFACTGSGGATFTATDTFNFGTNSGWSITPPADSALTPAGIATAVWEDLLAGGDFATAGSVGALYTAAGVATTSNKKKNTASAGFEFVMTSSTTNLPQTGLTVASQVSLDGGAFANTTNSVTELSNGVYVLNLSAADTNGNHVMLRFTATGANAFFAEIVTQP
jgi:hypothetical protein